MQFSVTTVWCVIGRCRSSWLCLRLCQPNNPVGSLDYKNILLSLSFSQCFARAAKYCSPFFPASSFLPSLKCCSLFLPSLNLMSILDQNHDWGSGVASSPGHSQILSHNSPWLRDKIWEWLGDESRSDDCPVVTVLIFTYQTWLSKST